MKRALIVISPLVLLHILQGSEKGYKTNIPSDAKFTAGSFDCRRNTYLLSFSSNALPIEYEVADGAEIPEYGVVINLLG